MYAVRIDDERAAPLYEIGETIVCSPRQKPEVKDKVLAVYEHGKTFHVILGSYVAPSEPEDDKNTVDAIQTPDVFYGFLNN